MMTPEQMASLHARAFDGQGRAWSADEFATLLKSAHVFCVGGALAFALGRVIADEAELLTIATDPVHRRTGLGRATLARFEHVVAARGAARIFLEVAADNNTALALYTSAGFEEIARRADYYARHNDTRVDAVIMEKRLR